MPAIDRKAATVRVRAQVRVAQTWGLAAIALSAFPACAIFGRESGITFASDPPGARVLIDKHDSGFVTPCRLALDDDNDVRVDFQFPGYTTATRYLTPDRQVYAILWKEMVVRPEIWHFPLWLNTEDFFVPIKYEKTLAPGRVFVRLQRAADNTPTAKTEIDRR